MIETNDKILEEISKELIKYIGDENYNLWFKPINIKTLTEDSIEFSVPNKFFEDWVQEHFKNDLTKAIQTIFGKNMNITFFREKEIVENIKPEEIVINSLPDQGKVTDFIESYFNPKYTFENFVVGESNKFAQAAAEAICKDPGSIYNPLYIYGGVGLGKTHLLNAMGNKIKQNFSDYKLLYITAKILGDELIDALKNGKMALFYNKYKNLDVLLIDDIQFLGRQEFFQQTFFHTFNSLYENHKQIVISSDCQPQELPKLEERLKSRFEWGLIVDIKAPDLETRIAILRKKAEKEKIYVPDDVMLFIASKIKRNIRVLESSLTTLVAHSSLIGSTITIDLAKELLKIPKDEEELIENVNMNINVDKIISVIVKNFNIEKIDLIGKSRQEEVAYARQIAMYIARLLTNKSSIEIGEDFGGRDHSTVLYAEEKIKKKLSVSPTFNQFINKIINEIKAV